MTTPAPTYDPFAKFALPIHEQPIIGAPTDPGATGEAMAEPQGGVPLAPDDPFAKFGVPESAKRQHPGGMIEVAPGSFLSTKAGRLLQGMAEPAVGLAQLGAHLTGFGTETMDAAAKYQEALHRGSKKAAGIEPEDWDYWAGAGNIVSPVNLIPGGAVSKVAGKAVTLGGRIGRGAAAGAGFGATMPVGELPEGEGFWERKGEQAAVGAAIGGAAPPVLGAAANVISPVIRKGAKVLEGTGGELSFGQKFGGWVKRGEDALSSWPLVGNSIRGSQRRGFETVNKGIGQEILTEVGEKIPKETEAGYQTVGYIGDKLSEKYREVHAGMSLKPTSSLVKSLDEIGAEAYKELPAGYYDKIDRLVQSQLAEKFAKAEGMTLDGEAVQRMMSKFKQMQRAYAKHPDPENAEVGHFLRRIVAKIEGELEAQNPSLAPKLRDVNSAWGKFLIFERAAGKAGDARHGVFTAHQLSQSVKEFSGKHEFQRGEGRLHDIAIAMNETLPQTIPDSGTPERMFWAGLLGAGHMGFVDPSLIGAAATIPLAYSRTGQRIVNALLTKRPPGAEKVANVLRRVAGFDLPGSSGKGARSGEPPLGGVKAPEEGPKGPTGGGGPPGPPPIPEPPRSPMGSGALAEGQAQRMIDRINEAERLGNIPPGQATKLRAAIRAAPGGVPARNQAIVEAVRAPRGAEAAQESLERGHRKYFPAQGTKEERALYRDVTDFVDRTNKRKDLTTSQKKDLIEAYDTAGVRFWPKPYKSGPPEIEAGAERVGPGGMRKGYMTEQLKKNAPDNIDIVKSMMSSSKPQSRQMMNDLVNSIRGGQRSAADAQAIRAGMAAQGARPAALKRLDSAIKAVESATVRAKKAAEKTAAAEARKTAPKAVKVDIKEKKEPSAKTLKLDEESAQTGSRALQIGEDDIAKTIAETHAKSPEEAAKYVDTIIERVKSGEIPTDQARLIRSELMKAKAPRKYSDRLNRAIRNAEENPVIAEGVGSGPAPTATEKALVPSKSGKTAKDIESAVEENVGKWSGPAKVSKTAPSKEELAARREAIRKKREEQIEERSGIINAKRKEIIARFRSEGRPIPQHLDLIVEQELATEARSTVAGSSGRDPSIKPGQPKKPPRKMRMVPEEGGGHPPEKPVRFQSRSAPEEIAKALRAKPTNEYKVNVINKDEADSIPKEIIDKFQSYHAKSLEAGKKIRIWDQGRYIVFGGKYGSEFAGLGRNERRRVVAREVIKEMDVPDNIKDKLYRAFVIRKLKPIDEEAARNIPENLITELEKRVGFTDTSAKRSFTLRSRPWDEKRAVVYAEIERMEISEGEKNKLKKAFSGEVKSRIRETSEERINNNYREIIEYPRKFEGDAEHKYNDIMYNLNRNPSGKKLSEDTAEIYAALGSKPLREYRRNGDKKALKETVLSGIREAKDLFGEMKFIEESMKSMERSRGAQWSGKSKGISRLVDSDDSKYENAIKSGFVLKVEVPSNLRRNPGQSEQRLTLTPHGRAVLRIMKENKQIESEWSKPEDLGYGDIDR